MSRSGGGQREKSDQREKGMYANERAMYNIVKSTEIEEHTGPWHSRSGWQWQMAACAVLKFSYYTFPSLSPSYVRKFLFRSVFRNLRFPPTLVTRWEFQAESQLSSLLLDRVTYVHDFQGIRHTFVELVAFNVTLSLSFSLCLINRINESYQWSIFFLRL